MNFSLKDDPKLRNNNNAALQQRGFYVYENETIANTAARALAERVPCPKQLADAWRHIDIDAESYLKAREKLVAASWRPEHAAPVRKYAKEVLLHSPAWGLRDDPKEAAAKLLEAIGTAEDHPAIISALDQVLTLSQRMPLESPLDYGLIFMLLDCTKTLNVTAPAKPTTPGEIAVYLQAATRPDAKRPADFQTLGSAWLHHPIPYIRRLTLEALPRPIPPWARGTLAAREIPGRRSAASGRRADQSLGRLPVSSNRDGADCR